MRELDYEIRRASALAEGRITKETLKEEVQFARVLGVSRPTLDEKINPCNLGKERPT